MNIGQVIGALFGGSIAVAIGPKKTLLLSNIPCIVGWLMIGLSPNLALLLVGRTLTGLGNACTFTICPMLTAQYCTGQHRGMYLSLYNLIISCGILLVYGIGSVLHWRILTAVPLFLLLATMAGMLLLPESPIWMLGHSGIKLKRLSSHQAQI